MTCYNAGRLSVDSYSVSLAKAGDTAVCTSRRRSRSSPPHTQAARGQVRGFWIASMVVDTITSDVAVVIFD